MSLIPCPSCSAHVLSSEASCPHCGGRVRNESGMVARTAAAVLMGFSLTGCPAGDDGSTSGSSVGQPDYGTPETDPSSSSSDGDSESTSSTGSDTSSGTTFVGEPDYGVPGTTGTGEASSSSSGGTGGSSSSSSG